MSVIKVKYLDSRAQTLNPMKPAKPGDAGIDLVYTGDRAYIEEGDTVKLETGVAVRIPDGWVGLITSRSSTFTKKWLVVVPAVIDSGYVGPLFVMVHMPVVNKGRNCWIHRGDRLAQLVVVPCITETEVVEDLGETSRGVSGFGSTGG